MGFNLGFKGLNSLPEYWWPLNASVAREWIQQENVLKG